MTLTITKSARRFGYVIWSSVTNDEMRKLLKDRESVSVKLNGFSIGEKAVDWHYHRISIGYKFTRALPETVTKYELKMANGVLEATTSNG